MPPLHKTLMHEDLEENPVIYLHGGSECTLDLQGKPADRTRSGRWNSCIFLFVYQTLERIAWLMLATNLCHYLESEMRENHTVATRHLSNWIGVSYMSSIFGGFIADAYLGRFGTVCVFSGVYVVGFLMMTMSVSVPSLKPPPCEVFPCENPTSTQVAVFYSALYVLALGTGGVWPCIPAFGADQFDDRDPDEKIMRTSYFNWIFSFGALGSLISWTALVYAENNVNGQWRFGLSTISVSLALCVFLFGVSVYRFKQPSGNPITKMAQVIVASFRKRRVLLPLDESRLYEEREISKHKLAWCETVTSPPPSLGTKLCHTGSFRCFDKAAVIDTIRIVDGTARIPLSRWQLCPVSQVEELKLVFRIAPIWMGTLMFNVIKAQVSSLFVQQGQIMDRRFLGSSFHIPSISIQSAIYLVILCTVPVYELLLVPFLKRLTRDDRGLSLLRRMGLGMALSILAILAAALVEMERLKLAKRYDLLDLPDQPVPMSIFWLLPQLILEGLGEVFTSVGQLEFFYDQAPDGMRTLGTALFISNFGVAFFFNGLLKTAVNRVTNGDEWIPENNLNGGHLDSFYWLLAAMASANLGLYILSAHCYKYKKVDTTVPSMDSRSFEWNASELGLMQKPTLFTHMQAMKLQSAGPVKPSSSTS